MVKIGFFQYKIVFTHRPTDMVEYFDYHNVLKIPYIGSIV